VSVAVEGGADVRFFGLVAGRDRVAVGVARLEQRVVGRLGGAAVVVGVGADRPGAAARAEGDRAGAGAEVVGVGRDRVDAAAAVRSEERRVGAAGRAGGA